jgi:hypothetical protein
VPPSADAVGSSQVLTNVSDGVGSGGHHDAVSVPPSAGRSAMHWALVCRAGSCRLNAIPDSDQTGLRSSPTLKVSRRGSASD